MNLLTVILSVLLVLLPGVPLVLTWYRALVSRGETVPLSRRDFTLVLPLFVAGLLYRPAIGSDYGHRRFLTIYLNLVIVLLMAIIPLFGRHEQGLRALVAVSAGVVALVWLYLAVVSSIV